MQMLILCCPAAESNVSSKIWVMQHGRAPQGALSPRCSPGASLSMAMCCLALGTLVEELSAWTSPAGHVLPSQITPLPGHALAGGRLKLNQAGEVRVAKQSSVRGCGLAGWPWHAPCTLRDRASLGCFSVGASRSGAGVG